MRDAGVATFAHLRQFCGTWLVFPLACRPTTGTKSLEYKDAFAGFRSPERLVFPSVGHAGANPRTLTLNLGRSPNPDPNPNLNPNLNPNPSAILLRYF